MADKPGDEVVLGKKFAGEKFSTVKSVDEMIEQQKLDAQYEDEHAVPLDVYLTTKRINDPVRRAMMMAFTKVRKATHEAFDGIFATF